MPLIILVLQYKVFEKSEHSKLSQVDAPPPTICSVVFFSAITVGIYYSCRKPKSKKIWHDIKTIKRGINTVSAIFHLEAG